MIAHRQLGPLDDRTHFGELWVGSLLSFLVTPAGFLALGEHANHLGEQQLEGGEGAVEMDLLEDLAEGVLRLLRELEARAVELRVKGGMVLEDHRHACDHAAHDGSKRSDFGEHERHGLRGADGLEDFEHLHDLTLAVGMGEGIMEMVRLKGAMRWERRGQKE